MSARPTAVLALAAVTLVAGCSSGSTTTSPSSSAGSTSSGPTTAAPTSASSETSTTASAGVVTSESKTFTVTLPTGWVSAVEKAATVPGIDLVVMNPKRENGFSTNIVVTSSEGDAAKLDAEIAKGKTEMVASGRKIVENVPTGEIDGEPVKGFGSTATQQGVDLKSLSYGVVHGGRLYIITASAAAKTEQGGVDIARVLQSWTWT